METDGHPRCSAQTQLDTGERPRVAERAQGLSFPTSWDRPSVLWAEMDEGSLCEAGAGPLPAMSPSPSPVALLSSRWSGGEAEA